MDTVIRVTSSLLDTMKITADHRIGQVIVFLAKLTIINSSITWLQIGEERFEKLNKLRRKEGEDNETFYKEQSTKYRKLVNQLIKEHGINKWW